MIPNGIAEPKCVYLVTGLCLVALAWSVQHDWIYQEAKKLLPAVIAQAVIATRKPPHDINVPEPRGGYCYWMAVSEGLQDSVVS